MRSDATLRQLNTINALSHSEHLLRDHVHEMVERGMAVVETRFVVIQVHTRVDLHCTRCSGLRR